MYDISTCLAFLLVLCTTVSRDKYPNFDHPRNNIATTHQQTVNVQCRHAYVTKISVDLYTLSLYKRLLDTCRINCIESPTCRRGAGCGQRLPTDLTFVHHGWSLLETAHLLLLALGYGTVSRRRHICSIVASVST